MAGANLSGGRSDWLASETTQHGLSRYISTLRERWWLVALCTAAALANAFAAQPVRLRTDQLRQQLDLTIPALRQRVAQLPQSERAATNGLPARLAALEALRGVPDPTIRVATPAVPPDKPSKPR